MKIKARTMFPSWSLGTSRKVPSQAGVRKQAGNRVLREALEKSKLGSASRRSVPYPLALVVVWLTTGLVLCADAREIIDMAGRTVTIPERIAKVYSASPPATYMLYVIDSSVIAGLNNSQTANETQYLRREYTALPILGGFFGQGMTPNLESILVVKPDLMIASAGRQAAMHEKIEGMAGKLKIPLVYLRLDELEDYPEALLFLGRLLGREERGRVLSEYAEKVLAEVERITAAIPEQERPTVYYAEAADGLSTECDRSRHAALINVAAGRNVYRCEPRDTYGREKISLEQIVVDDPRVILAGERAFFERVYNDSRWQGISAVKNRRVHLIPSAPFNWFDRPPSFMRLLGVQWLLKLLHPHRFPLDLEQETRRFYKLFLDLELGEGDLKEILGL